MFLRGTYFVFVPSGTFKLQMEFTEEYPNKPPTVRFLSRMFHPNGKLSSFYNKWFVLAFIVLCYVSCWSVFKFITISQVELVVRTRGTCTVLLICNQQDG